jgi:hypothetical protein
MSKGNADEAETIDSRKQMEEERDAEDAAREVGAPKHEIRLGRRSKVGEFYSEMRTLLPSHIQLYTVLTELWTLDRWEGEGPGM